MQISKWLMPPALVILTLCLHTSLTAQISDGYKKLEQKDYAGAKAIFDGLKTSPKDSLEAFWGLTQVFNADESPNHHIDSAFIFSQRTSKAFKKVKDSREKKKLKKKYGIESAAFTKITKDMPDRRWKEIQTTGTLRDYDNFLKFYPRAKTAVKTEAKKKQVEALKNAVASSKTFDDLQYLYNTHSDTIKTKYSAKELTRIENALFPAFLSTHTLPQATDFFKQLTKHPLTLHRSRLELDLAIKKNTIPAYLSFCTQNASSPFNPFVVAHIEQLQQEKPLSEQEANALKPDQKDLLSDIQAGIKSGVRINCYSEYKGTGTEQWIAYIKRHAPDACAEQSLRSIVAYAFANRQWKAASDALRETGSLFPKDSAWVKSMRKLVDLPDSDVVPTSLGMNINTLKGDEYSPALSADGKTLAFCARYRPDNFNNNRTEDIFISTWSDSLNAWGKGYPVRELNTISNEAPLCFSTDGNTLVLFDNGQTYTSTRNANGWGPKVKFPMNLGAFNWVSDVRFGAGEQVLFFAGRKGSASDIWFSTKNDDGVWNEPQVLPAPINSSTEDRSPFLHPDMQTLYFSTDRAGGFGGLDVYKTVRLDNTWTNWSEPVNLGKAINTIGNNWGYQISTDGSKGYYSAANTEGGLEDIYSIELPKEARPEREVRTISICVIDENKKPLPNTEVEVTTTNNKIIGKYRTPPNSGTVVVYVPVGEKYSITPVASGRYSESVSVEGATIVPGEKCREVVSRAIKSGEKTILNADIFFDVNQSELKSAALAQINGLVGFAKREKYTIALGGHTDPTGTDEDNMALSQARANAVKAALVAAGMPEAKITATGYGKTKLACPESTPECYSKCRRVEVEWKK